MDIATAIRFVIQSSGVRRLFFILSMKTSVEVVENLFQGFLGSIQTQGMMYGFVAVDENRLELLNTDNGHYQLANEVVESREYFF